MVRSNEIIGAQTQPDKVDSCTYCGAIDSEENPLNHGAVYDEPYSEKPSFEDYVYCTDCANGHHSLAHYYFRNCLYCEREFVDSDSILEHDDENNPLAETACLRCIREANTADGTKCGMCGSVADGYYTTGLCAHCEHGCVLSHKDDDLRPTAWIASNTASAHTPAPWLYQPSAGDHDYMIYEEQTGKDVALVRNFNEANARLIAAAPELLAACQALISVEPGGDIDSLIENNIRPAIAKAESRTNEYSSANLR